MRYARSAKSFQGAAHLDLVPLLVPGGVQHVGHRSQGRVSMTAAGQPQGRVSITATLARFKIIRDNEDES